MVSKSANSANSDGDLKQSKGKKDKTPKPLSKAKMASIKKDVIKTIADVEYTLPTLEANDADFEGGYAYIEDYLRVIIDLLSNFEVYDEDNCKIWGGLADLAIDMLNKTQEQYKVFKQQNKIPSNLVGVSENIDLTKRDIEKISKKTGCNLKRKI
jgi:hypothetical protein